MDGGLEPALLEPAPNSGDRGERKLLSRIAEETKKIVRISLPTLVSRAARFGLYVVTQSYIGHITALDLAGYALVLSITSRFIDGIVLGMSSATETLCGQAFGAKQYHMMGIYLQRSWIVNFVTCTVMLPVLIFATPIYKLLGEDEDIAVATEQVSLWFIPIVYTFVFGFTIQMFLQAQMKNQIIGWLSAGTFLTHLLISWLFVSVLDLGVAGAMGALTISQWLIVFGEWIYIFGGWCRETWTGFSMLALADLVPVIKLSVSSGFMLCLELWYTSVLVLLAGYSSDATVEISAFSICLNINAWEFMIALALMTGACVRVSNELGSGNVDALKFSIKVLCCMSAALGTFFCVLCLIFGKSYPHWFTSDAEVAEAAANLSVLLALTMFVSSFQAVFTGVAIGCGAQAKVAIVNIVSYYVIGVPIGCVLAFVLDLGIKGIWIGMLIGMVIQVLVLVVLTMRYDWNEEVKTTKGRLGRFFKDSPQEADQVPEET